jgi:DNA-binding winged helix-turn-helix (wHTH) protein
VPPTPSDEREHTNRFEVGEWVVEPMLYRITRGDEVRHIRPRAMGVLECLAEARGAVVTRQRITDRVWRTEYVTTNALTHVVAELRTSLGDDADRPMFIETIPRRGYRLVAPVSFPGEPKSAAPGEASIVTLLAEDGAVIELQAGANLIGRASDAAIRIDTSEVSRRHAVITVDGPLATIEDLGSKNGTFLRGRRLDAPARLADADEITIGVNVARFRVVVADDRTATEAL